MRWSALMTFDEYMRKIPSTVSEVKEKLLRRLWSSDTLNFPKPWVSSQELLELTEQKYFDRRLRELRDQTGCDVETEYNVSMNGHAWRIKSPQLNPPQNREYLSQNQKNQLFATSDHTCSICGSVMSSGVRGLQADHKIPISRGGGNNLDNWQPICNVCNVGKRRACEGCSLNCKLCSWAYPEVVGIPVLLSINGQVISKVKEYAKINSKTLDQVFEEAALSFVQQSKK